MIRWSYACLHAVLMLVILFAWSISDISLFMEGALLKWQSAIKHTTILSKYYNTTYDLDDIIFVDVSNEKVVLPDRATLKNQVVTDRILLDSCFKMLASTGGYKFLLCDIGFDIPSDHDSVLALTIKSMPNSIGFPHDSTGGNINNKWLNFVPGGVAGYSFVSNNEHLSDELLKFRLVGAGGKKSLPVFMAGSIEGMNLESWGPALHFSGRKWPYLNNITVDCQIRSSDLYLSNEEERLYTLTDLITMLTYQSSEENRELIKNKIIAMGDFENDVHKTAIEPMPGVMILLNIFLALVNDRNAITPLWVLYLFVSFAMLSYLAFYGAGPRMRRTMDRVEYWLEALMGKALSVGLINLVLLFLCSFVSYFLFDNTIEIVVLSLWLTAVELVKQLKTWFESRPLTLKNFHSWLVSQEKS